MIAVTLTFPILIYNLFYPFDQHLPVKGLECKTLCLLSSVVLLSVYMPELSAGTCWLASLLSAIEISHHRHLGQLQAICCVLDLQKMNKGEHFLMWTFLHSQKSYTPTEAHMKINSPRKGWGTSMLYIFPYCSTDVGAHEIKEKLVVNPWHSFIKNPSVSPTPQHTFNIRNNSKVVWRKIK